MSFGFSVTDITTLVQLAEDIVKGFVNAPKQLQCIRDELHRLKIVLEDIAKEPSEKQLSGSEKTRLCDILKGSYDVLTELQNHLNAFDAIDCPGNKIERAWKRFRWKEADIEKFRDRIVSNVTVLTLYTTQNAGRDIARLVSHQDEYDKNEILDWLSKDDYSTQHADFEKRRQEGTQQWLLESEPFLRWLQHKGEALFCPGMPGAGKTIATAAVIEHTGLHFRGHGALMAYVYCDFRRTDQDVESVLSSILRSCVQGPNSFAEDFLRLCRTSMEARKRLSVAQVIQQLHKIISLSHRVNIFVDAVDELPRSPQRRLVEEFLQLRKAGANIFITSRNIPEIERAFENSPSIEIRAANEDIERYLLAHIPDLPRFVSQDIELRDHLVQVITAATNGM